MSLSGICSECISGLSCLQDPLEQERLALVGLGADELLVSYHFFIVQSGGKGPNNGTWHTSNLLAQGSASLSGKMVVEFEEVAEQSSDVNLLLSSWLEQSWIQVEAQRKALPYS